MESDEDRERALNSCMAELNVDIINLTRDEPQTRHTSQPSRSPISQIISQKHQHPDNGDVGNQLFRAETE